jgi:hypothetical protein
MSAAFLCVQFRNLLPSEELLLFARALWADLQARGDLTTGGDATLAITQNSCNHLPFEVELTVEGSARRSTARDINPLLAVQEAFARISGRDTLDGAEPDASSACLLSQTATVCSACESL